MIHIRYYVDQDGKAPFEEWANALDVTIQVSIFRTIEIVSMGGAKKSIKSLKHGLFEIKIPKGAGYRVYFCKVTLKEILLLCGGDKNTQKKDIERARKYRRNHAESK